MKTTFIYGLIIILMFLGLVYLNKTNKLQEGIASNCTYKPSSTAATSILNGTVPNWCTDNAPPTCIDY